MSEAMTYTPKQLEKVLQLSRGTIAKLLLSKQLHAQRAGRKWVVPHTSVVRWLEGDNSSQHN
jgi:excisionase family DNA binding protein